ncbi:zinc finger protein 507 [Paramormyrops kingsleyae]|uniref:Zinc finger protein 507 n=1 Tax=Paramormyrops kingsleyae TaxID=1676925 RepID=A0A3B3SJA7_9TELE|nr:zinc finger protein 507 [Paramormyrops kingsleyae]
MEDNSGIAVLLPHSRGQQDAVFIPERVVTVSGVHLQDLDGSPNEHSRAADSLIQVIEKLSKIVEKPVHRYSLSGKKRPHLPCVQVQDSKDGSSETPCKKSKETCAPANEEETQVEYYLSGGGARESGCGRVVTCYQCSLCRYISPTLSLLKEHLRQHELPQEQSNVILVCSECCFTSHQQKELEAHIRLHLDGGDGHTAESNAAKAAAHAPKVKSESGGPPADEQPVKKKWYSCEKYGMYRCLICSYVCGQQRMLKTHAWKHAGLVDCSYPIFEDESAPDPVTEAVMVVRGVGSKQEPIHGTSAFEIELCEPAAKSGRQAGVAAEAVEEAYESKVPFTEEPAVEVQVTTEQEPEATCPDSLLSSAQKIISRSPNSAGHVNVIVERVPGEPFLVTEVDKRLLPGEAHPAYYEDEEVVVGWCGSEKPRADEDPDEAQEVPAPPPDENMPPTRRRTHSESLRLHSLAAEALVAMPTRTAELSKSGVKSLVGLSTQGPDTGQGLLDVAPLKGPPLATIGGGGGPTALVNLELQTRTGAVTAEGPAKMGISTSLLTVIEKLRERTDQNTSDEDILKELQVNAQGQPGPDSSLPESSLVEVIPNSERPFRCRLCRYTSGNKGYIKQHLRVHRQRQPYQCPICDFIACDSKDLETHMINHCKTRMYHCKQCNETFYYKSQLRSHEREQHGLRYAAAPLMPVTESGSSTGGAKEKAPEQDACRVSSRTLQKLYKCDVCDYTSPTYVGVRNHRRIHNSDKPYRCCSCDFATTNMNSLKSHIRRHPQDHQAVQLMDQYRCSLCGYVCSHPPSLKSHMWKHAGDQNYNYEQVNRAINEAMSQSNRLSGAAHKSMTVSEVMEEQTGPASDAPAKHGVDMEAPGAPALAAMAPAPADKATAARLGAEHCVLLFCCCICGFESASKERLMEHMKEHEGEIISIILSKELPGAQTALPPAGQ